MVSVHVLIFRTWRLQRCLSFHSRQRWRWNLRSTCTVTLERSPACLSVNPTASWSASAKMAPVSSGTSTGQSSPQSSSPQVCVSVMVFVCCLSELLPCFSRLCYVQSLTGHKSPVTAVSASETTGDIATVCDSGEDRPPSAQSLLC